LVVSLLDQVDVVLGIGGAKQSLEFGDGNAVHAGAVAIDVDVEVRLVPKQIRAGRRREPFVALQLLAQRVSRGINLVWVDPADRVTVTPKLAAAGANVDL